MTPSYERSRQRSERWQDWYLGRNLDNPMELGGGGWAREAESVPYNTNSLGRFFEKQTCGRIATFWRREGNEE